LALVGFLILHLVGNLLALAGPDVFNGYSESLVRNPLLVPAELGLLSIFLVHAYKSVTMWTANQRARPQRYQRKARAGHTSRKTTASSTMILTGIVTFLFVIVHLKTFKYGPHYVMAGGDGRDLYRLMVEVFTKPGHVLFYIAAMALIGMHLRHGISSAFQSLGVDHPHYTPRILAGGFVLAILIAGGFALIPIWIFFMGRQP
jgi:succinate dehydrogenase / fumarate reductase cytochrome b subunit